MKSIGAALLAHFGQECTSISVCWRVARRDGQEFFFTSHDTLLTIDGDAYAPESGMIASEFDQSAGLNVDSINIIFELSAISEADIQAGKFDGAEVDVFLVNWSDLTQGKLYLAQGWTIGNIEIRDHTAEAECRGKAQHLQQNLVELYSPSCRAELGDSRCKLNLWQGDGAQYIQQAVACGTHDKVLFIGGGAWWTENDPALATWDNSLPWVLQYDPATDTWSKPATNPGDLPFGRLYHGIATVDSVDDQATYTDYITDIYIISGESGESWDGWVADSLYGRYVKRVLK